MGVRVPGRGHWCQRRSRVEVALLQGNGELGAILVLPLGVAFAACPVVGDGADSSTDVSKDELSLAPSDFQHTSFLRPLNFQNWTQNGNIQS